LPEEVIFVFSYILSDDIISLCCFITYALPTTIPMVTVEMQESRVNSSHRFAGLFSVPPRRSI